MTKKISLNTRSIIRKIHFIRGQKVILDTDLAELYNVETKYLKRQVKRNIKRFPPDFMFQLKKPELEILRCQFGTSSWGGVRYEPLAFTEQGVAQLSGILNSTRAIEININIIRIFIKMREMLLNNKDLLMRIKQIESKLVKNDEDIENIFHAIRQLISPPVQPRKSLGYKIPSQS